MSRDYYLETSKLKCESAVNDYAGVYTQEQIDSFEEKMRVMRDEYDCNVVAVIINNPEWDSSELTAPEQLSESFLNLDSHKSTVVLWLNICRDNRALYVLGYGSAEFKITGDEADEIARDLQGYVKDAQREKQDNLTCYAAMMDEFIAVSDKEMRRPYFYLSWWFHLILGIAAGIIVVAVLVHNAGGKMTVDGKTYMNQGFSKLLGRRDTYIYTSYVRTKKSSSSSGGGGGGHSHSSGGGRF